MKYSQFFDRHGGASGQGNCGATYWLRTTEMSGVYVQHCGHPTALRPYYIAQAAAPGGRDKMIERLKYQKLSDAMERAVELAKTAGFTPCLADVDPKEHPLFEECAA